MIIIKLCIVFYRMKMHFQCWLADEETEASKRQGCPPEAVVPAPIYTGGAPRTGPVKVTMCFRCNHRCLQGLRLRSSKLMLSFTPCLSQFSEPASRTTSCAWAGVSILTFLQMSEVRPDCLFFFCFCVVAYVIMIFILLKIFILYWSLVD